MLQNFVKYFVTTLLISMYDVSQCSIPIPQRQPGFVYKEGKQCHSGTIYMEAFLDLTCPDSKAAFAILKNVADYYGPDKLQLTVVMFPLPFHPHAFWASAVSTIHLNL